MTEQISRECKIVREALQSHIDASESLPAHLLDHLDTCTACRSFGEALLALPQQLRSALDNAIEMQGPPDFGFLEQGQNWESRQKIKRKPLVWAAAAMVFSLVSILGYFGYTSYRLHSFIREDNHLFVQGILEGSLFDAGLQENRYVYNSSSSKASTWFQESELSTELLGDLPFFSD